MKLLDFGVSKVLAEIEVSLSSSLQALGTPHYMSPEQIRHACDVDGRSDIWSLGIILYELLTGTTPFHGAASSVIAAIVADPVPNPRSFRADIPEGLQDVVMRALQKDRDERFPDARSMSAALAPFAAAEELVLASSVPPPPAAAPRAPEVDAEPETFGLSAEDVPLAPPFRSRWPWMLAPVAVVLALGVWWFAGSAARAAQTPAPLATAPATSVAPEIPPPVEVEAAPPPAPLASAAPAPAPAVKARPPVWHPPPSSTNPLTL